MSARPIMVQGTMSNVGKSVLVAGLCRVFSQDGHAVRPFKSQNMALNSGVTPQGLEMGRAQILQARACGVEPDVRMNPVLLKPTGQRSSQVIVRGEPRGHESARAYYATKRELAPVVFEAYEQLASECDIVVIEGAGSPAELNLRQDDFVNMGMARHVHAPVLLVGDIDPGGVFAQLHGTLELLEPRDAALVKGLVVNKFRGDAALFADGVRLLESCCGLPVLGVVPYLDLDLDDEDSLSSRLRSHERSGVLDVAIVRLPHLANFTDFNALERHGAIGVRYVSEAHELGRPDLLVLPGTKSTMADLRWLGQSGLAPCICALAEGGTPVVGICGGFQMLGRSLRDEQGVEEAGSMEGLGLLDVQTCFTRDKRRGLVEGTLHIAGGFFSALDGCAVEGYELHMGRTQGTCAPVGVRSGAGDVHAVGAASEQVLGTYVHGLFDAPGVVDTLADALLAARGLQPWGAEPLPSARSALETELDALARCLREALDMERVYRIVEEGA